VLGKDIRLESGDLVFSNIQDFAFSKYENNLFQAINDRLNTNKPEYTNKEYGSELYKVYGNTRNDLILNRIRGIVFETLMQEPRIKKINNIEVTFDDSDDYKVNVALTVTPIGTTIPLNLVYPFFVE